jgi:50S ribosomal subunit-associated GTPase HflX
MIDAFKSILQDTTYSNLVLLVVDTSVSRQKSKTDWII